MDRPTWRDRVRYAFDTWMSRGTPALIVGLFIASVIIVVAISLAVWLVGAARDQSLGLADLLWYGLLRTLDPGTMGGDQGSPAFLAGMLAVTLGGIFVISALIGILNTGLQDRLAELRKGRSLVIEDDHIVVLGWSNQIFTVLRQLVEAEGGRKGRPIVILADRDKVAMEDAIRERVGATGRTRIVCRSGSPLDAGDLRIVSVRSARSVIVLGPEVGDADANVMKTLLAIARHPSRRPGGYHVVAEVRERANVAVAEMVGRDAVELILSEDVTSRLIAQTCRQPGLSTIYAELLEFAGEEIYFVPAPGGTVDTYGRALFAYANATPIGIAPRGGGVVLNPTSGHRLAADDRLIVIAADDVGVELAGTEPPAIDATLIRSASGLPAAPERTLMLGWNRRATTVIRQLDHYAPPGSDVLVVASAENAGRAVAELAGQLRAQQVRFTAGDSSSRQVLEGLSLATFDHVVVLCDSDVLDVEGADARALVTLLHVRGLLERIDRRITVVSEMLDVRDRALAEVARADDFIVSEHLISLLVVQAARDRLANAVFRSLLDPEGSEIYLRPVGDYVAVGVPVPFATIVEAARRRGETAIGYRSAAEADDPAALYGVRLNPSRSTPIVLAGSDRIVVIAES